MQKNPTNLLQLQNLMKRDPGSYVEEFSAQWQSYLHHLHLIQLHDPPKALIKDFSTLLTFLSHVAPCFPTITTPLPTQLLHLLTQHSTSLTPPLRLTIVQSLILLQNRSLVSRFTLLPTFFTLFALPDKQLRSLLFHHIVADIRRVNRTKQNPKLNSALQNLLFTLIQPSPSHTAHPSSSSLPPHPSSSSPSPPSSSSPASTPDGSSMAAKKSLDVMVELWRRRVWTDGKTVSVLVTACFSPHIKIAVTALRFFLGLQFYDEEEEDSDADESKQGTKRHGLALKAEAMKGVVKRRKKRERQIKRATRRLQRDANRRTVHTDVAAIELIHDPQAFAERLFSRLRSSSHSFPIRLLMMNVISRLVGHHQLLLLNFYPFVQKYMQPHQRHVTVILTYLAQACHRLVPPDTLRPLISTLATHFVTDRSSPEVMMVGLNAIREVCARQPLVMTRTLLMDLAGYKRHRVKGVMMASRALIGLYREKLPGLLKRRERGKWVSEEARKEGEEGEERDEAYARLEYDTDVMGADLLRQREEDNKQQGGGQGPEGGGEADEWEMKEEDEEEGQDEEEEEDDEETLVTAGEVDAFLAELDGDAEEEEVKEGEDGNEEKEASSVEKKTADEERELDGEIDAEVDAEGEDVVGEDDDDDEEEDEGDADGVEGEDDADLEGFEEGEEEEEEMDEEDHDAEPSQKRQRLPSNPSPPTSSPADSSTTAPLTTTSALPYAATKIFTPKDFALLRQLRQDQATAASSSKGKGKGKGKRKREAGGGEEGEVGGVVEVDAIRGYRSRKRLTKEERLESVREGRDGAKGGGGKVKGGGSTNAEKLKAKPFMLVKHSAEVRSKQRQSFSAVQQKAQLHIKNLKRQGKSAKKKIKTKRGY